MFVEQFISETRDDIFFEDMLCYFLSSFEEVKNKLKLKLMLLKAPKLF